MSHFPEVEKIVYEGSESRNPLAFHHYNADEVVEGRTMEEKKSGRGRQDSAYFGEATINIQPLLKMLVNFPCNRIYILLH